MKNLILLAFALLALSIPVRATDVTIVSGQMNNLPFNPLGIGSDRTISVTVTSGSPTVISANLFPPAAIGIGGFRITIDGVSYTVQTVTSASSLTLSANYAGSSGTSALRFYKYVLMRVYATASFRPNGESYVVQAGAPGSAGFFKQAAASIVPDGSGNDILYLPQFILPATTDATITNQAKYIFAFHRPDGSLLQLYTCGATSQLRLPPSTPTNYGDLCTFNAPGGIVPPAFTAYTKEEIDQRFPSCTAGQMLYFATTGNRTNCLIVGSGLSISGGTITATGGGGGSGTVNNGTQFQIGYYAATGNTISSLSNWTTNAQGNFTLAPTLSSFGSPYLFTVNGPSHVGLLADTEATDINFNLNRTVQFSAGGGAFTNQRAIRIQAPTYSALSAETIANAITVDINSPSAGTNMTLTNSYALRLAPAANAHHGLFVDAPAGSSGDLLRLTVGGINIARFVARNGDLNSVFSDSALATNATDGFIYSPSMAGIPSGTPTSYAGTVPLVIDTADSRLYGYIGSAWVNLSGSGGGGSGTVNAGTQYQIGYYAANGTAISGLSNWSTNAQGNFTLAPTLSTTGSPSLFTVTGPAHTSLAADTEATDINFNLARTVQFTAGGGSFTTQRAIRMQAPTYSALAAETIGNAITLDVASPSAGTNMTLTNSYAVRVAPSANAHHGLFVDAPAGSTSDLLRLAVGGVNLARFVARSGDLNSVFSDSALATSATDGFIYSPSMAGIPTGTPTSYTGTVPFVIDTTNSRLYGYSGIWRNLTRDGDVINVVDEYGAVCDGATSAQTAIQNAINAAAIGTRKTVLIPGDCVVTGLTLTGPVILAGKGQGSILRSSSNAPIVDMVADGNFVGGSVVNLRIVGSVSAGSSQIGVRMDNATGALRFLIRDVLIENTGGDGLYWGKAFSSVVDNVRITESAGYNFHYNAPNQPSNIASNIYVGRVRASQPIAYYIEAGDFTGYNLNGIDNVLTGSIWMQVGTTSSPATAILNGFNAESWTSRGFKVQSSSTVVLDGVSLIVGDGGTAAASKIGIEFTLNGDGTTFFAPLIKRSKIGDSVNFADGLSAYNNSQPIQAPGFAPIDLTGLGPQTGGGANLTTYRNTTTSATARLARSDSRYNKTTITSSTTISNIGGNYYEVDSTSGPITLTLEWPGWAVPGTMIVVKDVGGNAATNNITLAASAGGTVNGSTFVMTKNREAVVLMPNSVGTGSDFRVVARQLDVIGDVSKVAAAAVEDYFPYWNASGELTSQGPIYRLSNSLVVLEGLLNNSNNSFDIGALSSNRFRTGYFGTSVDVGINSSVTGSVVFRNSTNANSTTLRAGAPSSALTLTLPTTLPVSAGCLQIDNAGAISQTGSACGSGGSGLGDPGANGIVVRTAVNITTARTLTGTANRVTVTNGDGVSANPTLDIGTDVVTLTGTQTLTNKTLTSPVISTIVNTGTLTLPTATDTLVGRATTDTLTNKTLSTSTSVSASISWGDGVTQTFNPNGTSAGVNVGGQAGDPSALNNGDVWYNSTTNKFRCRENGASVDCIGSGGGGVSGSGTANSIPKWSAATTLTNSSITDDGTTVTIPGSSITSGTPRWFAVRTPASVSGLTAATEATGIQLNGDSAMNSVIVSHATGGIATQRDIRVIPVTHSFALASTITTAITMDLASPIAGTNATLTNSVGLRILPSASAHYGLWIENTSGAATGDLLRLSIGGVNLVRFIPSNGDLNSVFSDSALGTTATDGFIYSPSMAGVPTGTPTSYTGTVPLVVDTTNSRLYGYIGSGWANLTGSGGGGSPSGSSGNIQWNNAGAFAGVSGSAVTSTGAVTLASSARTSGVAGYLTVQTPADTTLTAATASIGIQLGGDSSAATVTRQWTGGGTWPAQGQAEYVFVRPTYTATSSTNFGIISTVKITGVPVEGTNVSSNAKASLLIDMQSGEFNGGILTINTDSNVKIIRSLSGTSIGGENFYLTPQNIFSSGNFTVQPNQVYVLGSGGAERARFDSTGLLGINRTTSISAQVHGVSAATNRVGFRFDSATNSTVDLFQFNLTADDTSTVANLATIANNSNGTAASGFGQSITYNLESSTTNDRNAAATIVRWADATDASRTSAYDVQTVNNAGALTTTWGVQAAQTYGAAEFNQGNRTGAFTINWNEGNNQRATATGNWTTVTFSNIKVGAQYTLRVIQDATGGRTWTPPTTMKFPGGVAGNVLTGNANAQDLFVCISSDGTNLYCNGLFDVKNP